jgi:1-acyl-sn-glycerol-3-phosphate acyltransferase
MLIYLRGWSVEGKENIPRTGGAIIVSNHLNNADPCIIPGVFNRRMNIMAKKEMFKWPGINLLFYLIGAFPVDRQGADLAALREAQNIIAGGNMLLMFPEGTRSKDRKMHAGFPGSALIAYRTGAPIIPVAIWNTEHLKWPFLFLKPKMHPRVHVRIGKPFYPPKAERITSEQAKSATDDIMRHVAVMLPESYRGVYADAVVANAEAATADRI